MLSSAYLYGNLDIKTAAIQVELFELKKAKAYDTLAELKPHYNLLNFTQEQRDLDARIMKIKKAIEFCNEQIDEAKNVLSEV